jgi:transposase
MAGKTTEMSKIKQVIRMKEDGVSNRRIAEALGIDRGTVNGYVRKLQQESMTSAELLKIDEPVLERRLVAGTAAFTDKRFEALKERLGYYEKELERKHVTKYILWQEYLSENPNGYRYTQFCYHLKQLSVARNPTAVLHHEAGEKLFVDFAGDRLSYINRETGEIVKVQVFVACMPCSGYGFIMAVPSQQTEDFIHASWECLKALGGVPKTFVCDNLKAAVIKTDRYEPELNRVMEDFANHCDMTVMPARPRRPKDKALVENMVNISYTRIYAKIRNMTFYSLEELNAELTKAMHEVNQTRPKGCNYTREERFLAEEKPLLKALPTEEFEIKSYATLRVERNCCVCLRRGGGYQYYSVPYQHVGEKAKVIYTRTLVKIFVHGEQAAVHRRIEGLRYTINNDHLTSTHRDYAELDMEAYIRRAHRICSELGTLIEVVFSRNNLPPEMKYKTCCAFLVFARKTDPARLKKACEIALKEEIYSAKQVRELAQSPTLMDEEKTEKPLPKTTENVRGGTFYKQSLINFQFEEDGRN